MCRRSYRMKYYAGYGTTKESDTLANFNGDALKITNEEEALAAIEERIDFAFKEVPNEFRTAKVCLWGRKTGWLCASVCALGTVKFNCPRNIGTMPCGS